MNLLIGGNGNITKALLSILKLNNLLDFNYNVVDINSGISLESEIANNHDLYDCVLNLTTSNSIELFNLSLKYGLNYIDASLESSEPLLDAWRLINKPQNKIKAIFGSGMNPGLIEYVYQSYKPSGFHYAIELDNDSAYGPSSEFITWSPESYYSESFLSKPFISKKYNKYIIPNIKFLKLRNTEYKIIPHEEVFSFMRNTNCIGSCFLYKSPSNTQYKMNPSNIQVIHSGLFGSESVGILFCELEDNKNPYYVSFNTNHDDIIKLYGVNATCFQTACGVAIGLKLINNIEKGSYSIYDLSITHTSIITKYLTKFNLVPIINNNFVSRKEFNKLVRIFDD